MSAVQTKFLGLLPQTWLYLSVALITLCLRFLYTYTSTPSLDFLLKPTACLVAILTNTSFVYSPEMGYHFVKLHIFIERSCSGYNFWLCSFVVSCLVFIKKPGLTFGSMLGLVLGALPLSYLLTILANASRIQCAMFAHAIFKNHFFSGEVLHQFVGAWVYLCVLVAYYIALDYLMCRNAKNSALKT